MSRAERVSGVRAHDDVLGYLLKHAHLALEQRSDTALGPTGLTSRDLGVLRVIAGGVARSQQEVAALLGVDRTTMVALVDSLERRGIVVRRPAEHDRRRNVVALTGAGEDLFDEAERIATATEAAFTAGLDAGDAEQFRRALRVVLAPDRS
ncbi:MarR family winged helix-turn-helix transcriptional regulator [Actinomycetospora sp. NBRC 106378]|uniref:MarR family winged helix-turn-helix transcriptional regulator n=1 Tax=Actinomycetospora sp. NBRC 106378 TaxID=3032208 RepID=UPI002553B2F7|nr:MarR family winged helix-turn-helix transcriptional regulator [Actinomycetospora sp. NBRC 106378]